MDRGDFRMHVTNPDQPVTFDAVPKIVLHAEVHGVGADFPDPCQPLIATAKRAQPWHVANAEHSADIGQLHGMLRIDGVDADKAKATRADRLAAQPRQADHLIADRMIVLCVLLAAEIGHRFTGRLPKANPHGYGVLGGCHRGEDLDMPLQFTAEVDQDAGRTALARSQRAGRQRIGEHDLPWLGGKQRDGVRHAFLALPDDPRGGDAKLRDRRGGGIAGERGGRCASGRRGEGRCSGQRPREEGKEQAGDGHRRTPGIVSCLAIGGVEAQRPSLWWAARGSVGAAPPDVRCGPSRPSLTRRSAALSPSGLRLRIYAGGSVPTLPLAPWSRTACPPQERRSAAVVWLALWVVCVTPLSSRPARW